MMHLHTRNTIYSDSRKARTCCRVIFILLLVFIWQNSLQTASTSSQLSTGILASLQELWLSLFGTAFPLSHHLLRKLGHFSEFMLLGIFGTLSATLGKNKKVSYMPPVLYIGLAAAVIDETLQHFSIGRSPEVVDILIDHAGFLTGVLCVCCCYKLTQLCIRG